MTVSTMRGASERNPAKGWKRGRKLSLMLPPALLLLVTILAGASLSNSTVIAEAQDVGIGGGETLSRHLPIVAGLNESSIMRILDNLIRSIGESNTTELVEALQSMKQSIEAGNASGFSEDQERLKTLISEDPSILVELDEYTLRQLLLLASINVTSTNEGLIGLVDPRIYEGLEEYLSDLTRGYPEKEFPRYSQSIYVESGSVREALKDLEELPRPPRDLIPSIYEGGGGTESPARDTIVPLILLAASIGLIYAGYRARFHIFRGVEAARTSITRFLALRSMGRTVPSSRNPREAIVACYKTVTAALARIGYPKMGWETHREYYDKLKRVPWSKTVGEITFIYEKAVFSPEKATWDDALKCSRLAREVGKS